MTDQTHFEDDQNNSGFEGLPFEPGSTSELLSATRVFAIELLSIDAKPFVMGSDGLEHRDLIMELRLLDLFKGTLDIQSSQSFDLKVEQRRESEFFVTDYHGIWSHLQPHVGDRYTVIADTFLTEPAMLLQEGPLQYLLDFSYETDVRLAIEAERLYQKTLVTNNGHGLYDASSAVITFTQSRRSDIKDVFGRYFWARVGPVFLSAPMDLLMNILSIILAEDTSHEARRSLISSLYEAILALEPNFDLLRAVIRAYFTLLLQNSASSLYTDLIEIYLYNLLFRNSKPLISAQRLFSDPDEQRNIQAKLMQFDSDRARRLLMWLQSPS